MQVRGKEKRVRGLMLFVLRSVFLRFALMIISPTLTIFESYILLCITPHTTTLGFLTTDYDDGHCMYFGRINLSTTAAVPGCLHDTIMILLFLLSLHCPATLANLVFRTESPESIGGLREQTPSCWQGTGL